MMFAKKYRYKPIYKKFVNLKSNIQNRKKIIGFKKQKWKTLLFKLERESKKFKKNQYYKFYDQNSYKVTKFNNYFSKNYKQKIGNKKRFNLFYGSLGMKYLKRILKQSINISNQVSNKINLNSFFYDKLEKRLDVVMLRSNLVLSIRNARQLISHGHVSVNNKIITNSSVNLKKGDSVTFSKKTHKLLEYYLLMSDFWPLPPTHIHVNYKLFKIYMLENVILSNNFSKTHFWLNINEVTNSYKK